MPRRGENIYKRQDGRWEGRYINHYEINGKAKYVSVYGKSYKEVKLRLNQKQKLIGSNTPKNVSTIE